MYLRSLIAFLILANYLWLAGTGCISRPEESSYMLKIQTSSTEHLRYEECRYLRMDGLEDFMLEAIASRYNDAQDNALHHVISVVSGIDAHFLPVSLTFDTARTFTPGVILPILSVARLRDIVLAVYSPPE
jgi:hypothetical protein